MVSRTKIDRSELVRLCWFSVWMYTPWARRLLCPSQASLRELLGLKASHCFSPRRSCESGCVIVYVRRSEALQTWRGCSRSFAVFLLRWAWVGKCISWLLRVFWASAWSLSVLTFLFLFPSWGQPAFSRARRLIWLNFVAFAISNLCFSHWRCLACFTLHVAVILR